MSGTGKYAEAAGSLADLVRAVVLGSAVLAPLAQPAEAAVRFGLMFLVLVAARQSGIPGPFDLAFGVALTLATWASVAGWYAQYAWSDWVVHAVTGGSVAAVLYSGLAKLGCLPPLRDPALARPLVAITLIVAMLAALSGVLWEVYEWSAVRLGARMIVGYGDTVADLAMDVLGGVCAGAAMVAWQRDGRKTRPHEP
ncbi:hypothetical protein [Actinomadura sediminis]|uniref:DUF2238 domain-containing protein n=1 Tax=Actinomadura sediminis TaxID=1038904 RepID=A0ABW3EGB0_9ACTN